MDVLVDGKRGVKRRQAWCTTGTRYDDVHASHATQRTQARWIIVRLSHVHQCLPRISACLHSINVITTHQQFPSSCIAINIDLYLLPFTMSTIISHAQNVAGNVCSHLSHTAGYVGHQLQHTTNRLIPPKQREQKFQELQTFALRNPKLAVRLEILDNVNILTGCRPSSQPKLPSPASPYSCSSPSASPPSQSPSQPPSFSPSSPPSSTPSSPSASPCCFSFPHSSSPAARLVASSSGPWQYTSFCSGSTRVRRQLSLARGLVTSCMR